LRRLGERLIWSRSSKDHSREENEKEELARRSNPKKQEELQSEVTEEHPREENGFSNRQLSPSFIPPLTDGNALSCSCVVHPTLGKIPAVRQYWGNAPEY